MEKLEDFLSKLPDTVFEIIEKKESWKAVNNYCTKVENELRHYKKYGTFAICSTLSVSDTTKQGSKLSTRNSQRTKREVLNENLTANVPQIKLERISEIPSKIGVNEHSENHESLKENIKIEKLDMPPPQMPVKKNRKIKTENSTGSVRSTRSKASKKNTAADSKQNRESDVVFEKPNIETITLVDSDEESGMDSRKGSVQSMSSSIDNEENMRTTRTKTRNKKQNSDDTGKRNRSPSTDVEAKTKPSKAPRQAKRQKSTELVLPKDTSVYEDAQSALITSQKEEIANGTFTNTEMDKTYVTQKEYKASTKQLDETHTVETSIPERVISDETVRISDPKVVKNGPAIPLNMKDIMTDDEDDDNVVVTLPKKTTKTIKTAGKAIFSPFSGSPVKKRVEAFEKLQVNNTPKIPVRTTRTKTKVQPDKKDEKLSETSQSTTNKKDKNVTPQIASRYLTTLSNSASKTTKKLINESYISTKSASALKATQQEFREKEIRRREKEAEAIRKREALIVAHTEEKKKKRLEKQMKAQQTREALEKCKLQSLEQVERTRDEKIKQILAEKEEKLKKRREEERKRVEEEERKKAAEERKRAAQEELEKIKKMELKKALDEERRRANYKNRTFVLPIYLREKAPLLPTEDCYDSDDENQRKQIRKPSWASRERLATQLRTMNYVDKNTVSNFFILDVTTPDLRDIFEHIDSRKLKRTSSAIWRVPPRFTLMPTDSIIEDREEE